MFKCTNEALHKTLKNSRKKRIKLNFLLKAAGGSVATAI